MNGKLKNNVPIYVIIYLLYIIYVHYTGGK